MLGLYIESDISTLPNGKFWEHVPYIGSRAYRLMVDFEHALQMKQFKVDQNFLHMSRAIASLYKY